MVLGPVFWMEMRTGARRARHYVTRAFFVSVVFAIVIASWYSYLSYRAMLRGVPMFSPYGDVLTPLPPHELAKLGRQIFSGYSMTQFLLVLTLAPLYSAGAIAGDRERRVLEMVLTTDLRNIELVASKFLVRTIHLIALAAAALPVMFLCLLLGGVAAEDLLATFTLTLSTAVFIASLGLLVSIGSRRAYGAIVLTYLILLIAWLAAPVIASFLAFSSTTGGWSSEISLAVISLNPVVALMGVVLERGGLPGVWADAAWGCSIVYGGMAIVLLIVNILIIRRVGLWASRERVVRDKKRDRQRRTRRVWANPVAWREVRTIAVHRRMRWARILCLLFSLLVSSIVWIGWLADWLRGRTALPMDIDAATFIISCTATVAWILMALQGAVSFSNEREQSTLDALLTTPLTGLQIVMGKLQGIIRSSAFALAFPIGFSLLAWSRSVTSGRAIALSIGLILLAGLFSACLGLACSVRFGSSGKACGLAAGILLVLCLGMPLFTNMFGGTSLHFSWQRITFVSPSLNLSWALYDEQSRGVPYYRYRYIDDYRDWPQRLGTSTQHLGIEQLFVVLFVAASVLRIERVFRIRAHDPWRESLRRNLPVRNGSIRVLRPPREAVLALQNPHNDESAATIDSRSPPK